MWEYRSSIFSSNVAGQSLHWWNPGIRHTLFGRSSDGRLAQIVESPYHLRFGPDAFPCTFIEVTRRAGSIGLRLFEKGNRYQSGFGIGCLSP